MKTFSEYITYREGDGESGFSLNGYFHTTPKMGHGAYPRITCKDGFNVSVQASSIAYSKPRSDEPPYTHVEVGYPSEHESLLDPYADGESKDLFGYVPVEVVEKIVDKHGFKGASTRAQNQAESRLMEADEADEEPRKTNKVFVSIPKGGRKSLPHRPVVAREVSRSDPSAEKMAVSVIQTIHKLNGKTSKDLTPEQQEFLSSYKSSFPRGLNIPLNPDQFRSLMKLKKSFPDMFKS